MFLKFQSFYFISYFLNSQGKIKFLNLINKSCNSTSKIITKKMEAIFIVTRMNKSIFSVK